MRRINDYLDFQKYSTNGQEVLLDREEFMNSSFFLKTVDFSLWLFVITKKIIIINWK